MFDRTQLLEHAKTCNATDIHICAGAPIIFRVAGELVPITKEPLSGLQSRQISLELLTEDQKKQLATKLDFDLMLADKGGRYRINVGYFNGEIGATIRILPTAPKTIQELVLPDIIKVLSHKRKGLVLITGSTSQGKTTTMTAMIDEINSTSKKHVITIEDPIEYVHPSIKCSVTQRQLGADTLSFDNALKHILRQDPDVILVGEMRDPETADAVLTVAETGHFILTTGHAPSATQAMERVIDLFPPHQRHLAQTRLASLLVAALCQVLVPRADGSGRVAAVEIMLGNPAAKNLIREGKLYQLPNVIRTHRELGMISLDEALVNLYLKGTITGKSVLDFCNDHTEVEKLVGKVKL